MVAGMSKDKLGYEKQFNDNTSTDFSRSPVRKVSGGKKCTPGRICLNVLVVLVFVFLVCSSAYFFYQNCELRRQMKECGKVDHAFDERKSGGDEANTGHQRSSSHVMEPNPSMPSQHQKPSFWDKIAQKLEKCVKTTSHTTSYQRSVKYKIDVACVKRSMTGTGMAKGLFFNLLPKRQN